MHEASIAQSILQIAASRASKYEGSLVEIVKIEVGSFRNVDPESLLFAFNSMKQDVEFCEEASLEIQVKESTAICQKQAHTYKPEPIAGFRCPECGSGIDRILTGEELNVLSCTLLLVDPSNEGKEGKTKGTEAIDSMPIKNIRQMA